LLAAGVDGSEMYSRLPCKWENLGINKLDQKKIRYALMMKRNSECVP
jgi:hypothetical protein